MYYSTFQLKSLNIQHYIVFKLIIIYWFTKNQGLSQEKRLKRKGMCVWRVKNILRRECNDGKRKIKRESWDDKDEKNEDIIE